MYVVPPGVETVPLVGFESAPQFTGPQVGAGLLQLPGFTVPEHVVVDEPESE